MGLNYSLSGIFERENSQAILRELVPLLAPVSQARVADLDWAPGTEQWREMSIGVQTMDARGVAGLTVESVERENDFCFSLALDLEPETEAMFAQYEFPCLPESGLFSLGCFWLSVRAGQKYVLLELTAASSALSRLLRSASVAAVWRAYAERSGALLAYIDTESRGEEICVFPDNTERDFPDFETLLFKDDHFDSVDHCVNYIFSCAS